ncbi:16S rRNA (guanine(527)-N(7))-methyltransferase RsmG [Agriterribacter sp.]|uniref:16S rRNA (guanine(527)-N(7))-methyltransferase RsmG n=1 Tax=Agriterribacter sp. TaxID=2821509 RepID=UPI002C180435|nr:16S rRNA (guanine(527)-N(7))-methyltransferase RsmG [Agriterribacter sp.]HTN05513.1 16S rRNA (guanine(527)-N(7))-methyltransferase RsmG [Agriterribacter sp.]
MEEATGKLEVITRYFADFSNQQINQFSELGRVYTEWNEKINVISRRDIDSLYEKHVLHSLAIAAIFKFSNGIEVIDIGTGGGFPGIPLAIFFPEARFHLVDSIGKKLKVVNEVVNALQLKNVTTQHIRAEEIKSRQFDFAVSRAVAPLKELWQWSKPLLNREQKMEAFKNGLICMKGGDLTQEIKESKLKPFKWEISELFKEAFFAEKCILYIPA